MTIKNYFRWYHWILYPFCRKYEGIDFNLGSICRIKAFIFRNKMYVYSIDVINDLKNGEGR